MNSDEAQQLLYRYVNGTCTPQEKALVEQWYLDESAKLVAPDQVSDADRAKIQMWAAIRRNTGLNSRKKESTVRPLRWYIPAAAAVLLCFLAGTYLLYTTRNKPTTMTAHVQPDLAPGGQKAVLTLANGTTLVLDETKNGFVAHEGNTSIQKTQDGQVIYTTTNAPGKAEALAALPFNTLTIPRGGKYQLVLADGTKVWLNAASYLKYPTTFPGKERRVELSGEAYFEVAKDQDRPFRIQSGPQTVEVLGTHFNINAYANEPAMKTTLVEGRVKIVDGRNAESEELRPGQQAILQEVRVGIVVQKIDTAEAVAWKNGLFQFNKADIQTIARQLERWYDVEVAFEGALPTRHFSGKIYRNVRASEVLEILSYSNIHYRIENSADSKTGKRIIITQ